MSQRLLSFVLVCPWPSQTSTRFLLNKENLIRREDYNKEDLKDSNARSVIEADFMFRMMGSLRKYSGKKKEKKENSGSEVDIISREYLEVIDLGDGS